MNQVGLVGRLTKDPVFKMIADNRPHASFVLAINRNFKNQQGKFEADFILCIAWGKLAETIHKYCGKGSLIGVNGRLQTRTYLNADKVRVYTTEVVVEDLRFYQLKGKQFELQSNQQGEPDTVEANFEAPTEQITTTS